MTKPTYDWDKWDDRLKKRWDKLTDEGAKRLGVVLNVLQYPDESSELSALADAVKKRGTDYPEAEINFDAQGPMHVTYRVIKVVGLSTDRPVNQNLKKLRHMVLEIVEPPVYWFKKDRKRPRPHQVAETVAKRMFAPPHWREPLHASYPSGHATLAYTWAYLLAPIYPSKRNELLQAAEHVAKRREAAGVHFASDSAGGRDLAKQIADALLWRGNGPVVTEFKREFELGLGNIPAKPSDWDAW